MSTLQSNYKRRKLHEQRMLKLDSLIRENFDKATANEALKLIKQLNSIKWPAELNSLKSATKNAVAELKNVIAGSGRKQGIFDRLVGLFKKQDENPFVDVMAFTSAIDQFFTVTTKLVEVLQASDTEAQPGEDILDTRMKNMTVGDLLANSDTDVDENTFKSIVKKGLSPTGVIANLQTNWLNKYLRVGTDVVADEVGKLTPDQLRDLSDHVTEKLKGSKEIVNKVAAADQQISRGKEVPVDQETTPTSKEEPSEPSTGTKPTEPNKVEPGRQTAGNHDEDFPTTPEEIDVDQLATQTANIFKKLKISNGKEVLAALNSAGLLKMPNAK